MFKKVFFGFLLIFIVIQFIPVNLPEVIADNPNDLFKNDIVENEIVAMLKNSCYDCHSNETVYPWYSYVAPVSFLVSRDTREGRKELNFSDWNSLSKLDKVSALDDIAEAIEEGEMPMKIYPITHPKANLSDTDREKLIEWTENFADIILE
jgi:hypothetical protein